MAGPRLNIVGQDKLHLSPTRVGKSMLCLRQWGVEYVANFDGGPPVKVDELPVTTAKQRESRRTLAFGTEMHRLAEKWFKEGKIPPETLEGVTLRAGLKYWPAPMTEGLEAEYSWDMELDGNVFQGTADLVHFRKDGTVLLGDHKTCKSISPNFQNEEKLRHDVQCMTYAYAIMTKLDLDIIDIKWVYYQRVKSKDEVARTREVAFTVTRAHVEQEWRVIEKAARRMLKIFEAKTLPEDLPGNREACDAFYGCAFKLQCEELKEKDMSDKKKQAAATVAGLKERMAAKRAARNSAEGNSPEALKARLSARAKKLASDKDDPKINAGDPVSPPIKKKKKALSKKDEESLTLETKVNINELVARFLDISASLHSVCKALVEKLDKLD